MDALDLVIEPGERVLLLGASGSGKSTLLSGLAGVLGGADDGESHGGLLIDGVPAERARGRAGLVLQDPESQIVMSRIGDEVAFGCENLGIPSDELWRRVDEALDAVGLGLPRSHPTSLLSGGQKQRLALASVIAMRPGLVLLDEPTANLDPDGVVEVRDAVDRLARLGSTLVVVEHRVAAWIDVVSRVIVLGSGGTILADGPIADVLDREGAHLAAQGIWVPGFEGSPGAAAPIGPPVLRVEELSIARRTGTVIRSDLELDVAAGEVVAVTGPNGVGKSTLALTLAGLLPPARGEVLAQPPLADGLGPDPLRWTSRELAARIGTVFQSPEHQFLAATVRDEIAIGPRTIEVAPAAVDARVDALLERLDLASLAGANPFSLSGGQQRRLSVATALATEPRLLVLDEPTFGQDLGTWTALVALLDELRREGSGLVLVTHDPWLAPALAARTLDLAAVPA